MFIFCQYYTIKSCDLVAWSFPFKQKSEITNLMKTGQQNVHVDVVYKFYLKQQAQNETDHVAHLTSWKKYTLSLTELQVLVFSYCEWQTSKSLSCHDSRMWSRHVEVMGPTSLSLEVFSVLRGKLWCFSAGMLSTCFPPLYPCAQSHYCLSW